MKTKSNSYLEKDSYESRHNILQYVVSEEVLTGEAFKENPPSQKIPTLRMNSPLDLEDTKTCNSPHTHTTTLISTHFGLTPSSDNV